MQYLSVLESTKLSPSRPWLLSRLEQILFATMSCLGGFLPPQQEWGPRGGKRRRDGAGVGRVFPEKVGRKYGAPDENETNVCRMEAKA